MAVSTTSTLSPKTQAYYDKRFLLRAKPILIGYQFGQKRSLPGGEGDTVKFTRYVPLARQETKLDETLDGGLTAANRQALKTEEISVTADLWGDYVQISAKANITTINPTVDEKTDIVSQQAGESIDYQVMKEVSHRINRRRADADTTYQKEGTADSGSVTTLVADFAGATGLWNGGFLIITAGPAYGQARQISTSVLAGTTQTITVSVAFSTAITAASKFRIVVGTGIVAGDVLGTAPIRLAVRDLKRAKALKAERGYYIGMVNPDVEYDFMGDDTWVKAATYKDQVDSLYEGEIGKWFGIRFVGTTELIRETVAGVIAADGAVHDAIIIGRECYGVVELEGQPKKIYARSWDQLGQPIPLHNTIGWEVGFVPKMLNSMFGVNVMCGASA